MDTGEEIERGKRVEPRENQGEPSGGTAANGRNGPAKGNTAGNDEQADHNATPTVSGVALKHAIGLAISLVVVTAPVLCIWFYAVNDFEKASRAEVAVPWSKPSDFTLKPGPSSFWYDEESKQLRHLGPIDDDLKTQLVALAREIHDGNQTLDEAVSNYFKAIDELAYKSEMLTSGLFIYLVFLGGLSSVLGVQLRSVTNFVGVTCLKNQLDLSRWWPWYAMRPLVGFLLGIALILVLEAGLISSGDVTSGKTSWRLGVAFLAGFGSTDFTERLRLVAKTLFGSASK